MTEAGGKTSDMNGQPLHITSSDHMLADNGTLHHEVLRMFQQIFTGRAPVPLPQIP